MKPKIKDLLAFPELKSRLLNSSSNLEKEIANVDINRPGLTLVGFFDNFASDRIQIFGKGEYAYLVKSNKETILPIIKKFFEFSPPAIVFTHSQEPPDFFIKESFSSDVPVIISDCSTHDFQLRFYNYFSEILAPEIVVHGDLVDVFGVGVLIQGESGIGKSETALELIERGHRLIADDMVKIKAISESVLIGYTNPVIEYHMEFRGLGIIDIRSIYGIRSIKNKIQIDFCVYLEEWDPNKQYNRIGMFDLKESILNVEIPKLILPVKPGRNIPILIETAAMNFRLKTMGWDATAEFLNKVQENIKNKQKEKEMNQSFNREEGKEKLKPQILNPNI